MSNEIPELKSDKEFLWRRIQGVIYDIIKKRWGPDLEKRGFLPVFLVVLLLIFIYFIGQYLITGKLGYGPFTMIDRSSQAGEHTENLISSAKILDESNFEDGRWQQLGLASLTALSKDRALFQLVTTSTAGLLKFHQPISAKSTFELKFIPLGTEVSNIVILIHGLYEIVIGDDDYTSVTLKALRGVGQDWVPIQEQRTGRIRLTTAGGFRKGSEIQTRILHDPLSAGQFRVILDIKYLPNKPENADYQTLSGTYIFTPAPLLEPLAMSVGLIPSRGSSEPKAQFNSFKIEEREL
ncbi:MAG: hypothetical protein HY435_01560 [Candidatus Liptonbacteria bacterium]|nr:hypothetical protein [Candidatus Liptonbacteria bacterium]